MNGKQERKNGRRSHALGLPVAIVAVMGSMLMAASLFGCGTDDWNTGQDQSARVTGQEEPAEATSATEGAETARESVPSKELDEILPEPDPETDAEPEEPAAAVPAPPSYDEAEAAYGQGDFDRAARGFAAHVKDNPESAWGHYMLGLTHWKRGEYVAAATALERASTLRPDLVKAHVNLARVQLDAGRPSEAHQAAKRAVSLEPSDADVQRVLARSLHNLGLADRALEVYQEVLTLEPQDAWAMNNMGLILIEEERFREAISPLAQAIRLVPDGSVFHNNLGVALERAGFLADAAEVYRQTLAIDSTYARAAVSLDRVLPRLPALNPARVDLAQRAAQFAARVQAWQSMQASSSSALSQVEVGPAAP